MTLSPRERVCRGLMRWISLDYLHPAMRGQRATAAREHRARHSTISSHSRLAAMRRRNET